VTTFTIRISDSVAAGLSSGKMRASLDAFLRQPHPLPHDPGPGPERISLTLTERSVNAAAAYLQCSASSALRRIAIERLGVPRPATPVPSVFLLSTPAPTSILQKTPNPAPTAHRTETVQQDSASQGKAVVGALIQFLFSVLFLGHGFSLALVRRRTLKQHDKYDANNVRFWKLRVSWHFRPC
jgi:hypothetical protein